MMSARLRRPPAAARLERLRREDMAMLRIVSPVILGHTLKVLVLERAADGSELRLERLRERIAAGLVAEPRLRQRLHPTPLHLAPPAWVPDPDFELGRHVRSREPLSPGDEGLRESIAAAMTERLDSAHPLWAIDLLGPLAGGRAAVVSLPSRDGRRPGCDQDHEAPAVVRAAARATARRPPGAETGRASRGRVAVPVAAAPRGARLPACPRRRMAGSGQGLRAAASSSVA
jgi:Wax ester synthase/diacylglycerol acyltransferase catalytic domain